LYEKYRNQEVCIVIHCELSVNRGPKWGSIFRQIDRERNLKEKQPSKLSYPNVFILDGGYAAFYRDYPDLTTGGYRSLSDVSDGQTAMKRRCQARYNLETAEPWERQTVNCNRQPTKLRTFTKD
jgi:M-phase inducer tyrosine phosphatase